MFRLVFLRTDQKPIVRGLLVKNNRKNQKKIPKLGLKVTEPFCSRLVTFGPVQGSLGNLGTCFKADDVSCSIIFSPYYVPNAEQHRIAANRTVTSDIIRVLLNISAHFTQSGRTRFIIIIFQPCSFSSASEFSGDKKT